MTFLFFTAANVPLFSRDDPDMATWAVHEYRLEAEFPYIEEKAITRGMRIAFADDIGTEQFFEIRKVTTYEPGHFQRIVAEHICLAELSDEHQTKAEITNKTASQALTSVLTGTLWSVGTNTASGTQSANIPYGSVWDAVNIIQKNWNVYISPRVTWDSTGIIGRYLDIAPAEGTFRGVRLSINKNADELGITYDDTETLTALYGYGSNTENGELTFASVAWSATSEHPAKPQGQTYLEDPTATAAYGRNGRARYGYYQNNQITSASVLLQKTWEALKQTSQPKVTIECTVSDLYRLGYADQPLRLHDTAIVDIEPTGTSVQLEIIQLTVDLLNPTQTLPVIGAYIPNIVYITRNNTKAAGGRGGGGGGNKGLKTEDTWWFTDFFRSEYDIQMIATKADLAGEILNQAGLALNAQGVLVYSTDNVNMWQSKLNVEADRIGLVVQGTGANASIKAASIVASVNSSGSSVIINADKVDLGDYATVASLSATNADIAKLVSGQTTASSLKATLLTAGNLYATSTFSMSSGTFSLVSGVPMTIHGYTADWKSKTVVTSVTQTKDDFAGYTVVANVSSTSDTIYYLGRN